MGGHSIGIAFFTNAPVMTGVNLQTGALGAGGHGANMPLDGAAGLACQTLDFDAGAASCMNSRSRERGLPQLTRA